MIRMLQIRSGLLIFISTFIGIQSNSQDKMGKYEFGISVGILVYQGDLAPSATGSYKTSRLGINANGGINLSPYFLIRGNLLHGRLAGDDGKYSTPAYRQQRNFRFSATLSELSGQLVWRPIKQRKFTPFLYGGAGFSSLKINRDWSTFNYEYFDAEAPSMLAALAIDSAHELPEIAPVAIFGMGVKYFITETIALNAEYSYRFMRTDYLDGFSVAANADKKDHYMNYSLGISFHTGKKNRPLDCPAIRF